MGYVLSVTTFSPPLNNSTSLLDPSGLYTLPDPPTNDPVPCGDGVLCFSGGGGGFPGSGGGGGGTPPANPGNPFTFRVNVVGTLITNFALQRTLLLTIPFDLQWTMLGGIGAPGNPQVPVHGPWHYGNYCGAGGIGVPINAIDAACQKHDKQFGDTGADWTNMQSEANWNKLNGEQQSTVQQANQDLCNAMASIYPSIPSWNLSQTAADLEIYWYLALAVPQGAQCQP
jgi:hypothetical protein